MRAQRSLVITTLDPLPAWPQVHQLAVATAQGAGYRFDCRERRQAHAVIQVGLHGQGRAWTAAGERRIAPGQALLMRMGRDALGYGLAAGDPPWTFAYAELAGEQALEALGALIDRHGPVVEPPPGLARLIGDLADRPGPHHAVWDAGASARTAMAIIAAAVPAPRAAGLARRAIAWWEARLGEPVTVAEAAAALGVGREHLTRALRAALGEPPAAWLRRRRLDLARQLLAASGATVHEVARRTGWRSPAQFVRAYAARFGRTPGAHRGGIADL